MNPISLIKFPETSDLTGYGFDIVADRVVRFNKHVDGTYMNTRATYSINKKQFTHFDIRKAAMSLKPEENPVKMKSGIRWKLVIGVIILAFVFSVSECSFTINGTANVQQNHQ